MSTTGKVVTWTSVIAVLALAAFIFVKFCFVYSEGVNEGDINYFQKEGFLFKTYEGKMRKTPKCKVLSSRTSLSSRSWMSMWQSS